MADGGSFVSSRPSVSINGATSDAFGQNLLEAVVRAPFEAMMSAELRVVNWGPPAAGGEPAFLFNDIRLGDRLTLSFGLDTERKLFQGEITALEERYGDGAPQLVLLAEDMLHRMGRRRRNRVLERLSPDDIVQSIAADAGLSADARLSSEPGTWHQLNESDLALVRRLAHDHGARLRCEGSKLICRLPDPPPAPVELNSGDTLRRVRLLADLARQPATARANGWDLSAGSATNGQATQVRVTPQGTTAAQIVSGLGWPAEEIFADPFPATSGQANNFAAGAFDDRGLRFLAGDLVCVGNAAVVNGGAVKLSGVSPRLLGSYDVLATVHHFSLASGYETYARIARGYWN
jgi:phage protein D